MMTACGIKSKEEEIKVKMICEKQEERKEEEKLTYRTKSTQNTILFNISSPTEFVTKNRR